MIMVPEYLLEKHSQHPLNFPKFHFVIRRLIVRKH